ncbi:hypothetical protein [Nonomuraea sp. NPDC050691]|uniref:alpha/beta hydrolase family protein n=1 Tax=Nonomuraea sp. NPDC050691 TaxID=3155661 RepID=UPI0034059C48
MIRRDPVNLSPAVSRTAQQGARNFHLPAFTAELSSRIVEWRTGVDPNRLSLIRHPPKIRPPLLLIHTVPDTEHPIQESRDLVAAGRRLGWNIQFEPFAQGDHTEAWNVDRARYDRLVRDFLAPAQTVLQRPRSSRKARPAARDRWAGSRPAGASTASGSIR